MGPGRTVTCCLALVLATAPVAAQEGFQPTLRRAADLARDHRYDKVIELLAPLEDVVKLDTASRFEVDAELGRAYFHMGQYSEAYRHLSAALKIQPRRMEIGVYLEAAAWATGHRKEAFQIFDAILASGARDLYLPVTLPGEMSFLANAEVWSILDRHRRPLRIDLKAGSLGDATLGDSRNSIMTAFHLPPDLGTKPVIRARAGPEVLWIFHFDPQNKLDDIFVDVQHVLRYTPYRLTTACGLDWSSTPAQAMVALGSPASSTSGADGSLVLDWRFPKTAVSLEFGAAPQPLPPGAPKAAATLLRVRLHRPDDAIPHPPTP